MKYFNPVLEEIHSFQMLRSLTEKFSINVEVRYLNHMPKPREINIYYSVY